MVEERKIRTGRIQIKKVLYLNKKSCIYLLFFLAHLSRSSAGLKAVSIIDNLMVMLQILCLLFCFWQRVEKQKFSMLDLSVCFFYVSLFISTVMVSRDFFSWAIYSIQGIGAVFLIEDMMMDDERRNMVILRNVTFIFLLCNLFTLIAYPNGWLEDYYFLGSRIGFTPFCIFAVAVSLLCDYLAKERKISLTSCVIILTAAVNVTLQNVTTGIMGLILFGVMIATGYLICKDNRPDIVYALAVLFPFVAWIIIIFGRNTKIIQWILSFIGEDATFHGRTIIWQTALQYIVKEPLWGYGVTTVGAFYITAYIDRRSLPAHDELLNIMYQGGIIAFVCWNILFLVVGYSLAKCRENHIIILLSAMIFSFLCIMITEIQSQKAIIFMAVALAYQLGINHMSERTRDV